ncbi:hypothetical protein CK203_044359 [Vitis vinifera]|uniref:Reverse transcriptase zinc-binding domain-containing protein n=1 Tax=Vitis vinifera TaxID=29760 RepID=A0A438H8D8_VITVI|nr:hypothetical protein CK203_044359 [Vitis vinifera]
MSFPSLFALIVEKEVWVADIWDPLAEGGGGGWNPCFLRAFNDWEVEEAERFLERLQGKRVIEDVEDMVSWTETKSGKFSVKSLYVALEAGGSSLFPSSYIWNVNVQPKISFFAWEATWGKALTLDMVQKRGWVLANRCFMCLEKEENINHLLLHCSRTRVCGVGFSLSFGLVEVEGGCIGGRSSEGGKSWFAVESKTFEITIEETRGKLRGVILERSKGFSSWIKFGAKSLSSLLEGVEEWCRDESSSRSLRAWEEGGRKYRLECRSNIAGRYLLCSVRDSEAKRFCLVFPEGKGLVGGWFMLAQKLRALGITTQPMKKFELGNSTSVKEDYRGKGKEKGKGVFPDAVRMEKGELGEALWVHVGERDLTRREVQLSRCLVGCFGDNVEDVPPLSFLEEWAYESWSLKGGLKISRLGGALVLFEFEDKNGSHPKDVWVKVVGLPLHLWSREVFKSIGERCGGFIAVDEDTTFFSELQWARILVKAPGKIRQGTLQVVAGNRCWTAQASRVQVECGRGQGEAQAQRWLREGGPPQVIWAIQTAGAVLLARASSVPAEAEEGMDPELMVVQAVNAVVLTPRGWRGTDEALMEEASRYDAGPSPLSQLGHRGHSHLSSSSLGASPRPSGLRRG